MRVYLDNCCYNRPYNEQGQIRVHLEAEAKLCVQQMILDKKIELATSFALDYENACNYNIAKKEHITQFMRANESVYVGNLRYDDAAAIAATIMETGLKRMDATHIACAILARCDCFLTTDDRVLKYRHDDIKGKSPCGFVLQYSGGESV